METQQYKCPNCGADLRFHPKKQGFACDYCESFFTPEECKAANEAMAQQEAERVEKDAEFEEGNQLYTCPACGAELITDKNTTAAECYYCHGPVVLKGRLTGEYRPAKIIPFLVTRDEAHEIFKKWCAKRWFLPKDFTSEMQLLHMQGVYVPFWVANCRVHGTMRAVCKQVNTWTTPEYIFTQTKEYNVLRDAYIVFEGLPADGSSKIEDQLMEAIEPFDYGKAVDFEMSYLSGFLSDKYDVNRAQVFPRVRNRAVNGSDALLRSTMVGYAGVRVTQSDMQVLRTDWQYMLLPVWFMNYRYKGKEYGFAINGQTGRQAGTPPLNTGKLTLLCVLLLVLCTLLGAVIGGLLG